MPNSSRCILVTGGCGYIGSHTAVLLLQAGFDVVIADNLVNSSDVVLDRIKEITGREAIFHQIDARDENALEGVFAEYPIEAAIHFAGLKAVGESVEIPLDYYQNNLLSMLSLCRVMQRRRVRRLVFSSSATVYGEPASMPVREDFPTSATNPYGRTKLMIEEILRDLHAAEPDWSIALLRYFNPVGAHESGRMGEDPRGIPNNLMPYISQVAVGRQPFLRVWGGDWPTRDGTGVRDFIHIMDLAGGHLSALDKLAEGPGLRVYNLGTGQGYSVLDALKAFEKAVGREIPYKIMERRPGDVAVCYADPSKAERELGWKAARGLEEMTTDAWRWQQANPEGYEA